MNLVQPGVKEEVVARAPLRTSMPARTAARLVVVVPNLTETALLAGRIHILAQARSLDVLLVGAASPSLSTGALRRELALLAAFLENAGTHADVRVPEAGEWMRELQLLVSDDDLLAFCAVDGRHDAGILSTDELARSLGRPVYAFMDAGSPALPRRGVLASLAPWLGSVLIVLAFFWLQVLLSRQGEGAGTTGLLLGTVPVEIGLIWLYNALLG